VTTAAIYVRISLDQTGEGLGVARQLEDCLALAERLGWKVVAEFDDNDLSAYSGKTRPGFEALLAAMKRGEIGALICWHTDRLYRSMKDLERLIDVADAARVQIRTVQGGDLDLSNSAGRMVARILGSVARQESEHKGERQVRANTQKALAGHWQTANRAFGYTLDGQPLEPEASAVRQAVVDVLAGKSIQAVTREWNAAGLTTTLAGQERKKDGEVVKVLDGKWNSPRVRRLLVNPRYAGQRVHRERVTGTGTWTPLIDLDTHRGLVAYLHDPARITNHASFDRKYLGSGLYVCGICKATMKAAQPGGKNPGGRRYICRDSAHLTRIGEPADDYVTATVLERMTQPDAADLLANQGVNITGLSVKREALQRKLDGLVEQFDADNIDAEQFGSASRKTRAKLAEVDRQLADATRTSPAAALVAAGEDAWELWQSMSPTQRAQAVDEVAVVTIRPAPRGSRFNAKYIDIVWRRGP
jgi:site-specific DNA recombinase